MENAMKCQLKNESEIIDSKFIKAKEIRFLKLPVEVPTTRHVKVSLKVYACGLNTNIFFKLISFTRIVQCVH